MAKENLDKLLAQMAEKLEPFADKACEDESNYGLFCLLIKYDEAAPPAGGIQTYTNVSGKAGIVAEGLYTELAGQIEAGEMGLYSLLREVLDDLKEDYDLVQSDGDDDGPLH